MSTADSPIQRAVVLLGGSKRKASQAIGVTWQTFHEWVIGKRQIPVERAVQIDKETRGMVSAEDLRPDLEWMFTYLRSNKRRV